MHFWLLIEGEPLVTDFDNSRLHRMCSLTEVLHTRGHKVTVWSSTTNHRDKTIRSSERLVTNYLPGYDVVLIDSSTYDRNISFARIIHNVKTAKKFKRIALERHVDAPDFIISAYPAIEFTKAGVQVAKQMGVPIAVDVRDLWPDIFVEILPSWLHLFARIAVYPFNRQARYIADNATAIIGITDEFVSWFEKKSSTKFLKTKKTFPLSYKVEMLSKKDRDEAENFWLEKGLKPSEKSFTICMFGNLVANAEIPLLVEAARKISEGKIYDIRFVVCGVGEILDDLREASKDLPNFYLPGWVTKSQIRVLMEMSGAGVLPYRSDRGFELSLPNKVGEYLSEGLPIISSISGVASQFLDSRGVGLTYKNQDLECLLSTIYTLVGNKKLRSLMSKKAYMVFQTEFNAESVYEQYADYLESLISLYRESRSIGMK